MATWKLAQTRRGMRHAARPNTGSACGGALADQLRYLDETADATNTECANCKRVMERERKQEARAEIRLQDARTQIPNEWEVQFALRPGASGYSWACSCGQRYDGTDAVREAVGYLVAHVLTCRGEVSQ